MPKISEFPSVTPADTDTLPVVQGGVTSRTVLSAIRSLFQSVANTAGKATQRDTDGSITASGYDLDTVNIASAFKQGRARWNDTVKTWEIDLETGTTLQLGLENLERVRNSTGSALLNGVAVFVNGATGNRPTVALAQANNIENCQRTIGLITSSPSIANNADGFVCVGGMVNGLNTSAFADGDLLYLRDDVAGGYSTAKPTAPGSAIVVLGLVARAHATQGAILVRVSFLGSVTGNNVFGATSQANARTALGLGTLSTQSTVTASQISDSTSVGRAVVTSASQAAARAATDSARNEVAQSSSYTAVAGERYVITSSATVTDPASPSNGQAYSVRISAGTATVGGVPYSAVGSTIVRAYNAGSWSTSVVWPNASNFGPTIGASRVVLLGDSITNQNGGPGPYTTFPTYNAIAGWFTWANIRLGHRLAMVQNAGKAGDRTDQILARFSTEVAPFAPHMVMLMAGTNDCAQSVSYATIIANLTSLYNCISEIGATCIAFTIPPIATANLSDANRTTLQRVNRWIKEQGRQRSKFIVVDLGSAIVNTTTTNFSASWTPAASTTSDGTHPAADGAVLMGRLLADALSPYVAASSFLATGNADTNNLITNGALSGTAGSWPTGWGGSAESSTWTYPARTDGIAGTWAQVAMTNFLQLIGTNITSGFSEGQKVYLTCEYELDYTPGQLRSFYLALYRNGANVAADPATFVQALNVPSKGVLETPAYTIPAGTTALRAYIFLTMSGTGVAATLRVARFGMHLGDPLAVN